MYVSSEERFVKSVCVGANVSPSLDRLYQTCGALLMSPMRYQVWPPTTNLLTLFGSGAFILSEFLYARIFCGFDCNGYVMTSRMVQLQQKPCRSQVFPILHIRCGPSDKCWEPLRPNSGIAKL